MAYDPNNVFAKILRGELPKVAVYEDDLTLALMDIMPQVQGHLLVIPKEPCETLFDCSPEGAAATIRTTQKVAAAVKTALDCPGILIAQLNGAAAGQSVPHLHFHILPREHGVDLTIHGRAVADRAELQAVADKIKAGAVILEHAVLNVKKGQGTAFEAALKNARHLIEATEGFHKMEVRPCVETKDRYLLLVWWSTVEAHTIGFRGSDRYTPWREALHGFYEPFPTVQHYGEAL